MMRARDLVQDSLVLFRDLGERVYITRNLDALGRIAAVTGQPVRAARLFGAAAALRESTRTPLELTDRKIYERAVAGVRAVLGEAALPANGLQAEACHQRRSLTQR